LIKQEGVVLASAARTATTTSETQNNDSYNGIQVSVNVSAGTSGFSVVPKIQGYDVGSGAWYDILTGAAITSASRVNLTIFPGAPVTSNVSANGVIPKSWRVVVTPADTKSVTYSVGFCSV
jgi:hypothetical protein